MKKVDDAARLGHIYDAICRIEIYINGIDKSTNKNRVHLGYSSKRFARSETND